MVIKAPTKITTPLFRTELEYIHFEEVKSFGKTPEIEQDEAEIREKLKGSVVEVGRPEPYNLKEMYEIQEIEPPAKMQMLFRKYDFWLIETPFSFMHSHNTHFEWARILAKMESLSGDIENPIVHDVYPKNIYETKKEKHKVSIGLSLKFAEIIEPKVQFVDEIEFNRLEPVIEVAGIGTSETIWAFSEGALSSHRDVNTLYTIVKVPQGTERMNLKFFLYAEMPTRLGLKLVGIESQNSYKIPF